MLQLQRVVLTQKDRKENRKARQGVDNFTLALVGN